MVGSLSALQNIRLSQFMRSFASKLGPLSHLNPDNLIYTALKGGASKATLYRIDLEEKFYVLRLLPHQASPLTRMHQIILARLAGKLGIGPEVYFVDPQMEGMIMQFISGRTVRQTDFEHGDHLANFALLLRKLHLSKERFPVACSPFQRFHHFVRKGEEEKIAYPACLAAVKALMEELEATFQLSPIPQVPSHLDLHPLNIMLTEQQFLLVDWVNGGMSDPYFDLTTFALFQ